MNIWDFCSKPSIDEHNQSQDNISVTSMDSQSDVTDSHFQHAIVEPKKRNSIIHGAFIFERAIPTKNKKSCIMQ